MKSKTKPRTKRVTKTPVPKLPPPKRQSLRLEPSEVQALEALKKHLNKRTESSAIIHAVMNYERIHTTLQRTESLLHQTRISFTETLRNIKKVKSLAEDLFATELPTFTGDEPLASEQGRRNFYDDNDDNDFNKDDDDY